MILILPFVYLTWMTPFLSDLRIAMDYPHISCPQQRELLFSFVNGSFLERVILNMATQSSPTNNGREATGALPISHRGINSIRTVICNPARRCDYMST